MRGTDVCRYLSTTTKPRLSLHAGRLEAEVLRVRAAAAGDEDLVDAQLLRLAESCSRCGRLSFPRRRRTDFAAQPRADVDPFVAEDAANARDDVGILFVDDLVEHLDDDDLAAEAAEDLRELDADVAAAEDEQRGWEGILIEERHVIEEAMLGQPFDRRHSRARAGGDDDVFGGEAASVDVDLVSGDELRVAEDHLDAECAELRRIVVVLDGVALRAHRIHDRLRRHAHVVWGSSP